MNKLKPPHKNSKAARVCFLLTSKVFPVCLYRKPVELFTSCSVYDYRKIGMFIETSFFWSTVDILFIYIDLRKISNILSK